MRVASFLAAVTLGLAGSAAAGACTTLQPQPPTYFDQTIDPILQSSCVRTNTGAGCHVADAKGNAFGNLDLSTYAGVDRRRDLLLDYGPYLQPSLLVKNVPPYPVTVQLWDGTQVQRHDGHQAHRRADPRPHGERLPDRSAGGSRTARPRTTRACAPLNIPRTRVQPT